MRFFIYNIYTINLHYKLKKIIIIKYKNIYIKNNNNNNKHRVYTYLQLCLPFKIPYIKGVFLQYDRSNCTQLCS